MPLEEVFLTLRCNRHGLTSEAAEQRLVIFGYNKLEEKKVLLFFFFSSMFLPSYPGKEVFFLGLRSICRLFFL